MFRRRVTRELLPVPVSPRRKNALNLEKLRKRKFRWSHIGDKSSLLNYP